MSDRRRFLPIHLDTRRLPALLLVAALAGGLLLTALAGAEEEAASEVRGKGSPPIVLIHSLGGDRGDWDRIVPRLEKKHRVILVDLPGHGASPPLHEPFTVVEVADAVEDVLIRRDVKNGILVGHSYGALVALQLALEHKKRAGAVVVIDAATFMAADSARLSGIEQVLRERYTVFLQAVYGAMSRDPLRGDTLITRASRVKPEVLSAYFREAWREDYRRAIRGLKTPLHLIATDALWPPGESWTSARSRLGYNTAGPAVGYRVHESGHAMMMDQPDSVAALLETIAAGVKP